MVSQFQIVLYPQVIHPVKCIGLTASILMIVALTFERFCAVHYPQQFREVSITNTYESTYLLVSGYQVTIEN